MRNVFFFFRKTWFILSFLHSSSVFSSVHLQHDLFSWLLICQSKIWNLTSSDHLLDGTKCHAFPEARGRFQETSYHHHHLIHLLLHRSNLRWHESRYLWVENIKVASLKGCSNFGTQLSSLTF